jgi:hypothetical protein
MMPPPTRHCTGPMEHFLIKWRQGFVEGIICPPFEIGSIY